VVAAILSVCGLTGCHRSTTPADADAVYHGIYSEFVHGNLDVAATQAQQARKAFSVTVSGGGSDANQELRLRLLEAQIRLSQRRAEDVLALLSAPGFNLPVNGDLAIQRNLLVARANRSLGHSQEAETELQEARALADSSHSALAAQVLHDEAMLQLDSGDVEGAREKLTVGLPLARTLSDPYQRTAYLVNLGYATFKSGHYDLALAYSQEAATLATRIHAPYMNQAAQGHVGWEYLNLGEFELALQHFLLAERSANELGNTGRRVIWLEDAGLAAFKFGNLQDARRYDDEALQAALKLNDPDGIDGIVNLQANLALLLYTQGQYEAARTYSDAATLAAQNSKDEQVIAYAMFLRGLSMTRLSSREDAQTQLLQARQRTPDPETRMEIENALANLSASAHDSMQAEQWYRRSIETFERNRASIQSEALRLSSFAYGDSIYRDYAQFLIASGRAGEALTLLDTSRARTLEEGLGFAPDAPGGGKQRVDPQAVARRLNASILFYALGREKSYLWAVTSHETRLFTLPKQQDLQSLVERYQKAIQSPGDPLQSASTTGTALYDALIAPAQGLLPADSQVYVVPDGALAGLNFETLQRPTADGVHYWIEDVTVTTTSSIRMLSRWKSDAGQDSVRAMLLMGDPLAASEQYPALSHGADEIARVRQHFSSPEQRVLTQGEAIPASYASQDLEQFAYLHFVAHGTASRLSPLESAVVLSPPAGNPSDFKLYARDIVQHPLHARLVTVSACYSSGVRAYAGEGLVGLAWAFLRAGAHNVIGALWEVNDDSTPRLMDSLYAELESGKTPQFALRAAKLSLLHSTGVWRRPYYWGAFQLYAGS
jgi:CHAT domain-containing protein/outer membrane protein assembly factor BamD (BamD/ComL family)